MKTKEELNKLKAEVETLNKKLAELSEDELKEVTGGVLRGPKMKKYYCTQCGYVRETFSEGASIITVQAERCPQCGAINSFAIGDA